MLTPQEAEALFATLRTMADEGRTVIFISHKLHEVKAVADRVTVLRGGRTVAHRGDGRTRRPRELAALMVGREVELARAGRARRAAAATRRCSSVEGLSVRGDRGEEAVRGRRRCPFASGEIVGVAGVAGNGQRELAEAITGMRPAAERVVYVGGRKLRTRRPARGDRRRRSRTSPRTGSAPASRRA